VRGSVYKRCQCRDANGKRVKSCRKAHGSWAFTIDAGIDAVTGKRKQIVRSGFRTRDEAEEEMAGLITAVNAGTWTDDQGVTLGAFLDQWLDEQAARGGSPKTLAGYRSHVERVWKPRLGKIRLRDLRREHVEKVLAELAMPQDGERAPGNSGSFVKKREAGTIDSYRRTLRAALSVAVRRGRIPINHAQGRMEAIPQRKPREAGRIWEPDETARFLEHVADDRLAALYELAAYAGLRRAELCGARWSDLDDDEGGITIRQTCVELTRNQAERREDLICRTCGRVHVGRILKAPKTNQSWRWVPLSAPAQASLAAHRTAQEAEREMFGTDYDDHDLIFCLPDGLPLRPKMVTDAFAAHADACKLPAIRLHDMRHGACSLLLAGGVPIEVVQMILGHASPEVTRRIYAHLMKKITAEQVEQATRLLTRHRANKR
jgi:integrase